VFDVELFYAFVLLLLGRADTDVHDVFGANFRGNPADVFQVVPERSRFGVDLILPAFTIVNRQGRSERHPVDLPRRRGVRRVDVGMRINPDHAQTLVWEGAFDPGNGATGRAVISG